MLGKKSICNGTCNNNNNGPVTKIGKYGHKNWEFNYFGQSKMRRVILILIKVGGGDPKKMDLTATIRTLIQVVYRVIRDVTNTHPY